MILDRREGIYMTEVYRAKNYKTHRSANEAEMALKLIRIEERIEKMQTTINQQSARHARACKQLRLAAPKGML